MRFPVATYRLQFHAGFPFPAAEAVLDYLRELGVSDIYASPVFRARAGSTHGYDVLDPLEFNPELGGREACERLLDAVAARGLGWVQDIVPNHMAVDSGNRWLMDVLEHGEGSPYWNFFDVDWNHPYEDMRGVLLLPFLGRTFGECLEAGELVLRHGEGGFSIHYYGFGFPLALESYADVVGPAAERLRASLGREHPDVIKLLGLLYILRTLPESESRQERQDQAAFVKRVLWELRRDSPAAAEALAGTVTLFNGRPGQPASFDRLEKLLARQHFKLAHWKTAGQEINYRRFFTINDLISLRVQYPDVFAHTHGLIKEMVAAGRFTGLRVDHIDGLFDPAAYLRHLRSIAPDAWIVVEKILEEGEDLPGFWPVAGASGYDFLGALTGLSCRPANRAAMTAAWRDFTGQDQSFADIVRDKKRRVIERDMAGDVEDLAHHVKTLAGRDRRGSDVTLIGLKRAMTALLAELPVYRTYFSRDAQRPADRTYLGQARAAAQDRHPDLAFELEFLERFLTLGFRDNLSEEDRAAWIFFALRFQQLSGPIMAKGLEDCALYVHAAQLALNEVGAAPDGAGPALPDFHAFLAGRAARWPHAMNGSTTHDTKRSEDARARLAVLAEAPALWRAALDALAAAAPGRETLNGRPVPDRNEECLLYQSILGALPIRLDSAAPSGAAEDASPPEERLEDAEDFPARLKAFAVKALREAKVHTGWVKPDEAYEAAVLRWLDRLWTTPGRPFFAALEPLRARLAFHGAVNSLAWTLVKIAAPGAPDFYQGTELHDFSLVDPDNRRPVDYARRAALLRDLKAEAERDLPGLPGRLLESWTDGRAKLFTVWRGLAARARHARLFRDGAYLPLAGQGRLGDHVLAFARRLSGLPGAAADPAAPPAGSPDETLAVLLAPLYPSELCPVGQWPVGDVWEDAAVELPQSPGLPGAVWTLTDALTGRVVQAGGKVRLAEALASFPVALYTGQAPA